MCVTSHTGSHTTITYYRNKGMKRSAELFQETCFTLSLGYKRKKLLRHLLGNPGISDFMSIYIYCKYTQYVQYDNMYLSVDCQNVFVTQSRQQTRVQEIVSLRCKFCVSM